MGDELHAHKESLVATVFSSEFNYILATFGFVWDSLGAAGGSCSVCRDSSSSYMCLYGVSHPFATPF